MIGFILVTHTAIGREMIRAIEEIIKEKAHIGYVHFDPEKPLEEAKADLNSAIQNLEQKDGIIFLTDIFGATPSNLCKEFRKSGKVGIITGCNLPLVLKAATGHFDMDVGETVKFLIEYGRGKILASEV